MSCPGVDMAVDSLNGMTVTSRGVGFQLQHGYGGRGDTAGRRGLLGNCELFV